jgi:Mn2+/Fe2+ NRAMP family transporter
MLLLMRITNDRRIMGRWVNTRMLNVLGWLTTGAIFAAAAGLIYFWIK